MGYQSRSRNFSFMGVDALRRTVEVVPDKEDTAGMFERPRVGDGSFQGTVAMGVAAFARAWNRDRIELLFSTGP